MLSGTPDVARLRNEICEMLSFILERPASQIAVFVGMPEIDHKDTHDRIRIDASVFAKTSIGRVNGVITALICRIPCEELEDIDFGLHGQMLMKITLEQLYNQVHRLMAEHVVTLKAKLDLHYPFDQEKGGLKKIENVRWT